MFYLRAAVALIAAMTFSLSAFGQTGMAIVEIPESAVPLAGMPVCTATFCKSIPKRYENTRILGITEYNYNLPPPGPPCKYKDHGTWQPGTNIKPTDGLFNTPAGTVDVSETDFVGPIPSEHGCTADGGPYLYALIKFKWDLHKNLTAVPGFGPTATFNSEWDTLDKTYMLKYSFQVTVPVVRPKGETTKWKGWSGWFGNGITGQWEATLKCCDAGNNGDPNFDFTGETTRERFEHVNQNCIKAIKGIKKSNEVSYGKQFPVIGGPPGKYIDGVSAFGDDADSACAALCHFRSDPAGCFLTVGEQHMSIRSPADAKNGFAEYPAVNTLKATSNGTIGQDFHGRTQGHSTVTSNRYTNPTEPPPTPMSNVTDISLATSCDAVRIANPDKTTRKFIFPDDCK